MRWVSPKVKRFLLKERLTRAIPQSTAADDSIECYSAHDIGVDADKFAYFAMSVAWRSSVHDWVLPDGSVRCRSEIGDFAEPIRLFLLGRAPFPNHTSVLVFVGSDEESRKVCHVPDVFVEASCLNFRFMAYGLAFRVMMGYRQPAFFRDLSCNSSRKWLLYANLAHRMPEILQMFGSDGVGPDGP